MPPCFLSLFSPEHSTARLRRRLTRRGLGGVPSYQTGRHTRFLRAADSGYRSSSWCLPLSKGGVSPRRGWICLGHVAGDAPLPPELLLWSHSLPRPRRGAGCQELLAAKSSIQSVLEGQLWQAVLNREQLIELEGGAAPHQVRWTWVPGHGQEEPDHNRADSLARRATMAGAA